MSPSEENIEDVSGQRLAAVIVTAHPGLDVVRL